MFKKAMKMTLAASFIAVSLAGCGDSGNDDTPKEEYLSYNDFLARAEHGDVKKVTVEQRAYSGVETVEWEVGGPKKDKDKAGNDDAAPEAAQKAGSEQGGPAATGQTAAQISVPPKHIKYVVGVPGNENVYQRLQQYGVDVTVDRKLNQPDFTGLFIFLGLVVAGGLGFIAYQTRFSWLPYVRKEKKAAGITFDDVAGIDVAKEEVREVVEFLKDPAGFRASGLRAPKGVLMVGPPGNGKTLLAKAIAGEAGVNFVSINASEFGSSKWMGVGTGKVKSLFREGRSKKPCIVFIDELDAIGRKRSGEGDATSGTIDRENTLNQLLVELDGINSGNDDIVLIAATNRPDVLDEALIRAGRIDRTVNIDKPDLKGRTEILKVHLKKVTCDPALDPGKVAKTLFGFSGADIATLVNEAGIIAYRAGRKVVNAADLDAAKDRVLMGAERPSLGFTEEEKMMTAYHEAGHALLSHMLPHSDAVYKATIVPRGQALGMVMRIPEKDVVSKSFLQLKADLAVAMAGRVAEELVYGKENITTGAAGDFQSAYRLARQMVLKFGMSDDVGPVSVDENIHVYSGISSETKSLIEKGVKDLLDEASKTAADMINTHKEGFCKLTAMLLDKETLDDTDIAGILGENRSRPPVVPNAGFKLA